MKILIADDHDLLRDTLGSYLKAEGDFEVTLAADLETAIDRIGDMGPFDIVLLDFSMPGMNGFDGLTRALAKANGRPVALISGIAPSSVGEKALSLGAAGFLPKTMPARSLINAIRFMAAGEQFLPVDHGRAPHGDRNAGPFDDRLTPRERQVLKSLCLGLSNKEIARDLNLSEPTIKLHVKMVCRKLEARNRTHAAMLAKEAGFC